jgi:hypothetical protein
MLRRIALCAVLVVGLGLTAAPTAASAATAGDSPQDPIVLSGPLPISVAVDTTAATADESEPISPCFNREGATVFYQYTATEDTGITLTTQDPLAVTVYTVDATGNLMWYDCGPLTVKIAAGQTYVIEVGTCCDETGDMVLPGGTGTLTLAQPPPPVSIDVSVGATTVNNRTGVATVTYTVTCNTPLHFNTEATLSQKVRGTTAELTWTVFLSDTCDPADPATETVVISPSGAFHVGSADLVLDTYAYDAFTHTFAHVETTVRLKNAH